MIIGEFIVNDHRFTFYEKEKLVEIEEFVNEDFKSRVVMKIDDFNKAIKIYKEWKKQEGIL